MRVAFRADASLAIGSGHVMRCRALAQVLQERGAQVEFKDESGIEAVDWLVVDQYSLDAAWESRMRQKAAKILVIDDLADRRHDCDVLLDQNWFPDAERRYAGRVPARCRMLLGPRYALLRPEFSRAEKRQRDGKVRRVLVSMGGMDPGNETSNAIRLLKGRGVAVDVAVGAVNPHREEIAHLCAQAGFELHLQPSNMAQLMEAADLAIGAGGTTTWERCCLGLPALQLAIAPNQEAHTRALADAGLVTYAGRSLTEHSLLQALGNSEMLKEQSRRVAELVDGLGASRVAAALLASPSTKIQLRNAQAGDDRLYFDWANDPAVRRQSFDSSPVAWPEHRAWFAQRLSDSVLLVAQDEAGVPVGQVRFERKGAWRVNYSVGAEFRGAGLGAKMLAMAIAELRRREPGARLQGEIKRDNAASRKVFAALGFRETSETMFELDA